MPFSDYEDASAIGSVRNQLSAAREESESNCQTVLQYERLATEDFKAAQGLDKKIDQAISKLVLTDDTIQELRSAQNTLKDVRDTAQGWIQSNKRVIEQCQRSN